MSKNKSKKWLWLIVLIAAASVYFVQMHGKRPASFKQNVKMTVTIETPNGDVSGYAVREISNEGTNNKADWPGGNPAAVRGEAIVIGFADKGKIFALIDKNGEEGRFYKAFPPPNQRPQSNEAMEYYAGLPIGSVASLDLSYSPMFVMFTDSDDPKSVVLVRGGKFNPQTQKRDFIDKLPEFFGAGSSLKNITLEITHEPVTWGVEQSLAWLPNVKMGALDGRMGTFSADLSNVLHYGNFSVGE